MGLGWGRGGGVQGDGVWEETTVSRQSFESVAKAVAVVWVVSEDLWRTLPAPSVGSPPTLPPSPPHRSTPVAYCTHVFRIGNNRGVAVYFCVVFAHNLRDPVPAGLVTRVMPLWGGVRGGANSIAAETVRLHPNQCFCWLYRPGGRELLARNLVLLFPTTVLITGILC